MESSQKKAVSRFFRFLLKRLITPVIVVALTLLGICFGPKWFGSDNIRWVSERFSETLREKNELIVYEVEIEGQETLTQDAWLIGTVQKVMLPYTFSMDFTVDLSKASVTVQEGAIEVRLPKPVAAHPKLIVHEDRIQKVDWLYPLTAERYAEMTTEVENRFFAEASTNPQYQEAAWNRTVVNLETLFQSVAGEQSFVIHVSVLNENE